MRRSRFWLLAAFLIALSVSASRTESTESGNSCERGVQREKKYILYDVNPGEGFNLRRDVYMRVAVMVKTLLNSENVVLVLPPWGPLYHWQSRDIGPQEKLPWSSFFHVKSLQSYIPVIEFEDFLVESHTKTIGQVFYLQSYEDAWSSGKWEEKLDIRPCLETPRYKKDEDGLYRGWFWGYSSVRARNFSCVSYQGHASLIKPLLQEQAAAKSILIDRAETMLHDSYGDSDYWKVRRSMRFADTLMALANDYRREQLNSTDEDDFTKLPDDWRDETRTNLAALGGPYVCGHLRRQDFLRGRASDVPSLKGAAKQLRKIARNLDISKIFIATDGTKQEMEELKSYLEPKFQLFLYEPSLEERRRIKDGGVAIVEQIICSRSRYFIGTHESTFSFRIQEEREILHLAPDSTFNRFCPDQEPACEQPARWRIQY